jgi:deoxycytidylate deaminase
MNSKTNILNRLFHEAKNSCMEFQMAAAIIKGNKIINNPCCNLNRNSCRGALLTSLHAEARAILNYFGKSLTFINNKWILNNYNHKIKELAVVKITKSGTFSNARPCIYCLDMMKSVGIKKVYYSVQSNQLVCENVKDMISIQISTSMKNIKKITSENTDEFYENLLKKIFPEIVKHHNLISFINYNLLNVMPTHKYKISNNIFIIYSKNNDILLKSKIL